MILVTMYVCASVCLGVWVCVSVFESNHRAVFLPPPTHHPVAVQLLQNPLQFKNCHAQTVRSTAYNEAERNKLLGRGKKAEETIDLKHLLSCTFWLVFFVLIVVCFQGIIRPPSCLPLSPPAPIHFSTQRSLLG